MPRPKKKDKFPKSVYLILKIVSTNPMDYHDIGFVYDKEMAEDICNKGGTVNSSHSEKPFNRLVYRECKKIKDVFKKGNDNAQ